MHRVALLVFFVVLAHTPLMAGAGVYDIPSYPPFCDRAEAGTW